MGSRVVVEISLTGLDWSDGLLAQLRADTEADGLEWGTEPVDGPPHQALAEIILVAVATKVTDQVVERVEAAVRRWLDRRLDPPDHSVRVEVEAGDGGDGADGEVAQGSEGDG